MSVLPKRAAGLAHRLPTSGMPAMLRRRRPVDPVGWTGPELAAYLSAVAAGGSRAIEPPRRPGWLAVRVANELGGDLPAEAVLLVRAIVDAVPPLGAPVNVTLSDIVEKYLPASLDAYRQSASTVASSGAADRAAALLVDQLRLLYDVSVQVQRAQDDHNETELHIQQAFLRERFGPLDGNVLDLAPVDEGPGRQRQPGRAPSARSARSTNPAGAASSAAAPPTAAATGVDGASATAALAAATGTHYRLRVDHDPVTLFRPAADGDGRLHLRLALPKGLPVTLSIVAEGPDGATRFVSTQSRRKRASRRQAGFGTAQVDLAAEVDLASVRRLLAIAAAPVKGDLTDAVLFADEGRTNRAELPTLLARRAGLATTVIASAYSTSDGLFLRNETTVHPSLRAACAAYGFRHLVWLSNDTPAI